MSETVQKHFVEFCSPGTLISETTAKEIDSWDVDKAVAMSRDIAERHNARPYGFRFMTRSRGPNDLDSKVTARSHFYWLGGTIRTAGEILSGTDPHEDVLRSNVRINNFKRIIVNTNSWKFTAPLGDDDVVLDYTPHTPDANRKMSA